MRKDWSQFKILVVEDDTSLLEVLGDYFRRYGANILEAQNGKEAIDLVENQKIDFIFSDIQMPVMDGIELLKRIRLKNPLIPIVLLATGHSELTKENALAFGASDLIHKPFNLKELSEKIDFYLQQTKS